MTDLVRCDWCSNDPIYQAYHDTEWGMPSVNREHLFEKICLEGQQAGLSWITILKKRACYRQHFFNFQPEKVATMTAHDIDQLMQDKGLIRHRAKLEAIVHNAQCWLALEQQGVDVVTWLWSFVNGKPQHHHIQNYTEIPTQTPASLALSKALKKAGFKFIGPTTCYALMQSVGMVNNHEAGCHCYVAN